MAPSKKLPAKKPMPAPRRDPRKMMPPTKPMKHGPVKK